MPTAAGDEESDEKPFFLADLLHGKLSSSANVLYFIVQGNANKLVPPHWHLNYNNVVNCLNSVFEQYPVTEFYLWILQGADSLQVGRYTEL